MKTLLLMSFMLLSLHVYTQVDTLYTNGKKIPCNVREITTDAIKYSFDGEDLLNSISKRTVQKIVFKSGRVQSFSESKSYSVVSGPNDFNKVTFTSVESDVQGLTTLGDLASKVQAGTSFTSMDKVIEKADKRVKLQAAMLGANVVYITNSKTKGFSVGTHGKTKSIQGIAFSDRLPDFEVFTQLLGDKRSFQSIQQIKFSSDDNEVTEKDFVKMLQVLSVYNNGGLIMLDGKLPNIKTETFRVTNFSSNEFTLLWRDGDTFYNFIINLKVE